MGAVLFKGRELNRNASGIPWVLLKTDSPYPLISIYPPQGRIYCFWRALGRRRASQKYELLHIFESPGFGGDVLPIPIGACKTLGEKDSPYPLTPLYVLRLHTSQSERPKNIYWIYK